MRRRGNPIHLLSPDASKGERTRCGRPIRRLRTALGMGDERIVSGKEIVCESCQTMLKAEATGVTVVDETTVEAQKAAGHRFNVRTRCSVKDCGAYHYECADCGIDCTAGTLGGPSTTDLDGKTRCLKCNREHGEKRCPVCHHEGPHKETCWVLAEAKRLATPSLQAAMGANVIYCGHRGWFIADIFVIGNAAVVRASKPVDARTLVRDEDDKATHLVKDTPRAGFWRPDLGIFVVPAEQVLVLGKES